MPARPTIPDDDLYARLEIGVNASPEAIEVAWRALLRRHHPDVAGPTSLEQAKRINVAHDWLSDPVLRERYDRHVGVVGRGHIVRRFEPWHDGHDEAAAGATAPARHRAPDPARALERFLDRVARLDADEIDRLACTIPPPIAFGATIARFLPPDRQAALEALEVEIDRRLAPEAATRPGVRDAVEAFGTELVLGEFLDGLLSEPFRDRTRERLTRGWEAAVGQPRYGPNGAAVRALVDRLAALDPDGIAALAAIVPGHRGVPVDDPWPPTASPDEEEALRVSSVLAARDAAAAVALAGDRPTLDRARRSAGRLAHLVALRHLFPPSAYARLTAPWRPRFVPDDRSGPHVRRP